MSLRISFYMKSISNDIFPSEKYHTSFFYKKSITRNYFLREKTHDSLISKKCLRISRLFDFFTKCMTRDIFPNEKYYN